MVAEAEAVMRIYIYETLLMETQGGRDKLSPEAERVVLPPFSAAATDYAQAVKSSGGRIEKADLATLSGIIAINPGAVPGSIVALEVCRGGRKTVTVTKSGTKENGRDVLSHFYFKRDQAGNLRIFSGNAKETTCGD